MMQIVFLTLVIALVKPIYVSTTMPVNTTTTHSPTTTVSESIPTYKGLHHFLTILRSYFYLNILYDRN